MSIITSGVLPILVLLVLLSYWLWHIRVQRSRLSRMTEAGALALIERTLPPVWTDLWNKRETPSAFFVRSWKKPWTYFELGPADLVSYVPWLMSGSQ